MIFRLFLLLSLFVLVSCAKPVVDGPVISVEEYERESDIQRELIYRQAAKERKRVEELSHRVFVANADLCVRKWRMIDFRVWNMFSLPKEDRDFGERVMGLSDELEVQYVYSGSSTFEAGLRAGDKILSLDGGIVPSGSESAGVMHDLIADASGSSFLLEVMRGDEVLEFEIETQVGCGYGFEYNPLDSKVNATANGERILIARGMYRFVESDDELALIISHELAHNVMGHIDKAKTNATLGGFAGLLLDLAIVAGGGVSDGELSDYGAGLGRLAHRVEFEAEADYVGMYMLARAGFDTSGVAHLWRRIGADRSPSMLEFESTHPSDPSRFVSLEKIHAEIEEKRALGEPLVPNLK